MSIYTKCTVIIRLSLNATLQHLGHARQVVHFAIEGMQFLKLYRFRSVHIYHLEYLLYFVAGELGV
jgi:hypothetical protein